MSSDLFDFKGRIARNGNLWRPLIVVTVRFVVFAPLGVLFLFGALGTYGNTTGVVFPVLILLLWLGAVGAVAWCAHALTARRARDIGLPVRLTVGVSALLFLASFVLTFGAFFVPSAYSTSTALGHPAPWPFTVLRAITLAQYVL